MTPNVIALLVLLIGVPLNVAVTWILWRTYRANPNIRVLRERLVVEIAVLILVVVFGFIFLNNDALPPPLDTDATRIITRLTVLGLAVVPALYWLWLWWRGR